MTTDSTITSRLGQVVRDLDGVRLEYVRTYAAPVDDVWSAVTDPDRLERWIGRWTGDPASGTVEFAMPSSGGSRPEPVAIDTCEPPRRLAVTIPTPDGPWPLTVTLTEQDGETELRFTHQLHEPYDASGVGPGWQYYLDRLGAVLSGTDVPDDFDAYFPALADAYPIPRA
jgi:uncharacterized protein YndB with AHSA1/START domain